MCCFVLGRYICIYGIGTYDFIRETFLSFPPKLDNPFSLIVSWIQGVVGTRRQVDAENESQEGSPNIMLFIQCSSFFFLIFIYL